MKWDTLYNVLVVKPIDRGDCRRIDGDVRTQIAEAVTERLRGTRNHHICQLSSCGCFHRNTFYRSRRSIL